MLEKRSSTGSKKQSRGFHKLPLPYGEKGREENTGSKSAGSKCVSSLDWRYSSPTIFNLGKLLVSKVRPKRRLFYGFNSQDVSEISKIQNTIFKFLCLTFRIPIAPLVLNSWMFL